MNLILDLDGTLVSEDLEGKKEIRERPYLKEFLEFCFSTCKTVSIWSDSKSEWCQYIYYAFLKPNLKKENKFFFVYDESKCTLNQDVDLKFANGELFEFGKPISGYVKKLQKLWKKHKGFTKENTFIVDDTPFTYSKNYGNAIPISTYTGEKEDRELLRVMEKLKNICKDLEELKEE